jgi:hypothetical protein
VCVCVSLLMILITCRSAAAAGGRAQVPDRDLGDKIEEGLGPHGLGIVTIADVSSNRGGTDCIVISSHGFLKLS